MDINKNNIEKVFQDSFQNFEKAAGPEVWAGVKAAIGTGAGAATAATAAKAGLGIGAKIAIVAAIIGVASFSTYLFVNQDEETTQKSTELVEKPIEIEINGEIQTKKEINDNAIVETKSNVIAEVKENKISDNQRDKQLSQIETKKKEVKISTPISAENAEKTANSNSQTKKTAENTENTVSNNAAKAIDSNKEVTTNNSENSSDIKDTPTPLKAEILINKTEGNGPLDIQFNSTTSALKYEWKLNDKIISNNQRDNYRIDKVGNYQLELVITDENNKSVSSTKNISVLPTIANIFTPNGDGANDIFRIDADFDQLEVRIFDQSAKEIHNWTGSYGFWDGNRADGSIAAEGTYFYIVKYSLNGIEKNTKGAITLKR